MRSSDWSSDVCSSDLTGQPFLFGCSCGRQSGWTSFSFPSLPPALSGLSQSRGCLTMVVSLYMRTPGNRPRDWEKRGAGTHVIAIRRERGSSEERLVGKECVSMVGSWWSPYHKKKNKI